MTVTHESESHHGRLRWRCRRGMRELDILLVRFLERDWDGLPGYLKSSFEQLLEVQDPVLMDWIMSRSIPEDTNFLVLIDKIRQPPDR